MSIQEERSMTALLCVINKEIKKFFTSDSKQKQSKKLCEKHKKSKKMSKNLVELPIIL